VDRPRQSARTRRAGFCDTLPMFLAVRYQYMIALLLSAMAVGVTLFSLYITKRLNVKPYSYSLLVTQICLGLLATGPMIFEAVPFLVPLYIAALPCVFFVLLPSMWLYHQALTSVQDWQWNMNALKHYIPLPFAFVLSVSLLVLPDDQFALLFYSAKGTMTVQTELTALAFLITVVLWCVLALVYGTSLATQTIRYRQRIKRVFSNEKGRMLNWVQGTSVLALFTLMYALGVLAFEEQYARWGLSESGVFVLLFAIVWCLAAFGFAQSPGFAEVGNKETINKVIEAEESKYRRSALAVEDMKRIARKLDTVLKEDALFLDSDLNLQKLASHIDVPAHYVTQTLNQALNTTFFDFINTARVEAAKPLLLSSNKTVLDVAMEVGFNARSSFYKAFKTNTGMTPSEYKKHAR